MNWRRGLFRLWIVGSALFVIAVAFVSYSEIKAEFDNEIDVAEPLVADWVYKRFYSAMPREQFDNQIASTKRIADPNVMGVPPALPGWQ